MYSSISDETLNQIAWILGGDEGVTIIDVLKNVEESTVEEIAEKTDTQINTVRKVLYKFYNHSLVTSRRFRDKETGWFIFQWSLKPELIEAFITSRKQKIVKKLQDRLDYEVKHQFYYCGNENCLRITFEDAMDTVFHCPICGEGLKLVDNDSKIHFLEKKIDEIRRELEN